MPLHRSALAVAAFVSMIAMLSIVPRPAFATQGAASATVAAVTRALSGNGELRRLKVTVEGTEVTLTGRLPNLWHKLDAVKRALKVEGVETVRPDIELPKQESDTELALFLTAAVNRYPYYTIFDYISALIRNGVVTLNGWVTPQGKKSADLEDQVAKVRGVQEIKNQIVTLPPSKNDDAIREELMDRIISSQHFEQFANVRNPPFRIVVQYGHVTLYGQVQGEVERRELESLARFTSGVLNVQNNLQTIIKPKAR